MGNKKIIILVEASGSLQTGVRWENNGGGGGSQEMKETSDYCCHADIYTQKTR